MKKLFLQDTDFFDKWWIQIRKDKWAYQTEDGNLDNIDMNHLNTAIYIKVEKQNEIENRDLYMKFIGSQTHVKCGCHKYHLITDRNNEKECVTDGFDNKVAVTIRIQM